jgi:hypothetical protein
MVATILQPALPAAATSAQPATSSATPTCFARERPPSSFQPGSTPMLMLSWRSAST